MLRRTIQVAASAIVFACLHPSISLAGGIHIHVSLKHPLTPIQVQVGPISVKPSVLPAPPSVHVDGGGTVAKIVNKGDAIAQTPVNVAYKIVTWPVRAINSLKDSIKDKLTQVENAANDFIGKIEKEAPIVLIWIVAGLVLIVAVGVIIGELFTHLASAFFGWLFRKKPSAHAI